MVQFIDRDGVIFVDDRDDTIGQQGGDGVEDVLAADWEVLDISGQEELANLGLVVEEALRIDPHQFGLPNGCQCLLHGNLTRSLLQS